MVMSTTSELARYVMGWREVVDVHRWHEFRAGLLSVWEIIILIQDMIEAGVVPSAMMEQAGHLIDLGLCRVPDLMTYH